MSTGDDLNAAGDALSVHSAVQAVKSSSAAFGIYTNSNPNGSVSGNRVRGLVKLGTGSARGIYNTGSGRTTLRGNDVSGSAGSVGLQCSNSNGSAKDNIISGFATAIQNRGSSGNMIVP